MSNVRNVCPCCMDKKLKLFKENNGLIALQGFYILSKVEENFFETNEIYFQSEFSNGEGSEHMWFRVTDMCLVNKQLYAEGELCNDPVHLDMKIGDKVYKSVEVIENIIYDGEMFLNV